MTDELAQKFNLGDDQKTGALVTGVEPHSLAAKAGIAPGDVITKVAGKKVANSADAAAALSNVDVKEGVRLYITNADGSRFVFLQKDE